jgi:hypothetical protein
MRCADRPRIESPGANDDMWFANVGGQGCPFSSRTSKTLGVIPGSLSASISMPGSNDAWREVVENTEAIGMEGSSNN